MRRVNFVNNLSLIFWQINQQGGDLFQCITDKLEHRVYAGIEVISDSCFPNSSCLTPHTYRSKEILIFSKKKNEYEIFILREPKKGNLHYPGIVQGSFKTYKKGIIRFVITENASNNGEIKLIEWENLISLSKKSKLYTKLIEGPLVDNTLVQDQVHYGEIYNQNLMTYLSSEGLEKDKTRIFFVPSRSETPKETYSVFVKDLGDSLANLFVAKRIRQEDYRNIACEIMKAGGKNPPVFVPYDLKPANIVMKTVYGKNMFHCIDYSSLSVTPNFFSNSLPERIKLNKVLLYAIFLGPNESDEIYDKLDFNKELTRKEAIYMTVADTIISTFICLISAKHIDHPEQFKNKSFIDKLKQVVIPELKNLPMLFFDFKELSQHIAAKTNATEERSVDVDFNWSQILSSCYR